MPIIKEKNLPIDINLPENLGEEWNGGNEYFLGVTKFGKNDLFVYLLFNNTTLPSFYKMFRYSGLIF